MAAGWVGTGEDHKKGRDGCVRDPDFAPVEDVAVAIAHRPRGDRRHVGAGLRLGHSIRAALTVQQARDVALLQRLVAAHQQRISHQRVQAQRSGDAGAGPGELLDDDRLVERTQPRTAQTFGDRQMQQAGLARLLEDLGGETGCVVILRGQRRDRAVGKRPRQVAHGGLFGREPEIHASSVAPVWHRRSGLWEQSNDRSRRPR